MNYFSIQKTWAKQYNIECGRVGGWGGGIHFQAFFFDILNKRRYLGGGLQVMIARPNFFLPKTKMNLRLIKLIESTISASNESNNLYSRNR